MGVSPSFRQPPPQEGRTVLTYLSGLSCPRRTIAYPHPPEGVPAIWGRSSELASSFSARAACKDFSAWRGCSSQRSPLPLLSSSRPWQVQACPWIAGGFRAAPSCSSWFERVIGRHCGQQFFEGLCLWVFFSSLGVSVGPIPPFTAAAKVAPEETTEDDDPPRPCFALAWPGLFCEAGVLWEFQRKAQGSLCPQDRLTDLVVQL